MEVVTIDGTLDGESIEARSVHSGAVAGYAFVYTHIQSRHLEVAITDFPDTCGNGDVTGKILYFDLFEDPTLPDSTINQPGTFPIWLPGLNENVEIPSGNIAVATFAEVGPDGGHGWVAQSGSVEVTAVSGDAISATFDVTFEAGSLSGSFTAPHCDDWARSASIAKPGS